MLKKYKPQVSSKFFNDILKTLLKDIESFITRDTQDFVDEIRDWRYQLTPITPWRKMLGEAVPTGYFFRGVENKLVEYETIKPKKFKINKKLKDILSSRKDNYKKLLRVVDYFNYQNKLQLSPKVKRFLLLNQKTFEYYCANYVNDIVEDYYSLVKKEMKERNMKTTKKDLFEFLYINLLKGYYFRIAEELVDNHN